MLWFALGVFTGAVLGIIGMAMLAMGKVVEEIDLDGGWR